MRIQETDRILKESRYARNGNATPHDEGFVSKALKAITTLPAKLISFFKH